LGLFRHLVSDNVNHVTVTRRSRKPISPISNTQRRLRYLRHAYTILVGSLIPLTPNCSAHLMHGNSISLWTLNISSGDAVYKMNTIHHQIMQHDPDIFILTDTRSDGSSIKSQWNWKDYQIRETKGVEISRNTWARRIFMGVKKHLPIIQEHSEIDGLNGRPLHVTVKTLLRGKGRNIKIIGIYAPPRSSQALYDRTHGDNRHFYEKLTTWMTSNKEKDWIMAGDFNCATSKDECHDLNRHQRSRTHYRNLLTSTWRFDWWEQRNRCLETDYTRKGWTHDEAESLRGKSIDRIASSSLFQLTEIKNRPDLFVGGTDHVWVHRQEQISDWRKPESNDDVSRQWIERRVKIPTKDQQGNAITAFQAQVKNLMNSAGIYQATINSDCEFDALYNNMTSVIVDSSFNSFGQRRQQKQRERLRSQLVTQIVQQI
jgi:exonuclease III